jgi:hypothetical protein
MASPEAIKDFERIVNDPDEAQALIEFATRMQEQGRPTMLHNGKPSAPFRVSETHEAMFFNLTDGRWADFGTPPWRDLKRRS